MSGNGSRLYRLGRLVPPSADDSYRVKVEVVFHEMLDRLKGSDRALIRDKSRHERGVGSAPDLFLRIHREALTAAFGIAFEERDSVTVHFQRAARPVDEFLAEIVAEARAWKLSHPMRCATCDAAMRTARHAWDSANA